MSLMRAQCPPRESHRAAYAMDQSAWRLLCRPKANELSRVLTDNVLRVHGASSPPAVLNVGEDPTSGGARCRSGCKTCRLSAPSNRFVE